MVTWEVTSFSEAPLLLCLECTRALRSGLSRVQSQQASCTSYIHESLITNSHGIPIAAIGTARRMLDTTRRHVRGWCEGESRSRPYACAR